MASFLEKVLAKSEYLAGTETEAFLAFNKRIWALHSRWIVIFEVVIAMYITKTFLLGSNAALANSF